MSGKGSRNRSATRAFWDAPYWQPDSPIIYKYNNGRGAVLCRGCSVILAERLSYDEAVDVWGGRDLCDECKDQLGGEG